MRSIEERVTRLEDAIVALADLRDPAMRELPMTGADPRVRTMNEAERKIWSLAQEIRAELDHR